MSVFTLIHNLKLGSVHRCPTKIFILIGMTKLQILKIGKQNRSLKIELKLQIDYDSEINRKRHLDDRYSDQRWNNARF